MVIKINKKNLNEFEKKFWSNVDIPKDPDGCWLWKGLKNKEGNGILWVNGKKRYAGSIAYELQSGFDKHENDTISFENPNKKGKK